MTTCNCIRSSSFVTWLILPFFSQCIIYVTALPVSPQMSGVPSAQITSSTMTTLISIVVTIASIVCLIITVVVCLCNCFRKSQNPSQSTRNGFSMTAPDHSFGDSREFTMFPPAGSNSIISGPDDVYFEPLPDLSALNQATNKTTRADKPRPVMFSHVVGGNLSFQDWFEDPYANFPRMRLRYVHELGSGWFGQVVEGEAINIIPNEKKTKVVVKILMTGATTTDQMYFLHEVKPFRNTSHPNVLKLLGKCLESDPFLIILEHCIFDDLKNYLIKHRPESESLLRKNHLIKMAWDIAAGLQYLHSCGFIITDLAARNCLVSSDLVVKIGDYGNSIEKYKGEYYCAGGIAVPVRWCAPETLRCTETIMETKEVTVEANVWSFGVVVWEIFEFGKLPYFDLNDDALIQRVIIERRETLKRPLTPCRHMDHIYHIICLCHMEANKRPTMSSLCDMLEILHASEESGDAEGDFERRWNQLRSPIYNENSVSPSSTPSLLHLEDVPLSDISLVEISHSYENEDSRTQLGDFDVDDASWKRILETSKKESGEIIKMIQEKSQSVQDLMKLTVIDIESGSESDAPCITCEESSEDSLNTKEHVLNVNKDSILLNNCVPLVPDILVNEATNVTTVAEHVESKTHSNLKSEESPPIFNFVLKQNAGRDVENSEGTVSSDAFNSRSTVTKRRTSTPHKSENSFVIINSNLETLNSNNHSLDLYFNNSHLPSISTIHNSTDEKPVKEERVVNGAESANDITYDLHSSVGELVSHRSIDEGLEMSEEEEEEGSSYSLLTVATNQSEDALVEEEDCILMVDLETNKAVLVDVPVANWDETQNNVNQQSGFPGIEAGSNSGHFEEERASDDDETNEEETEEVSSEHLVISNTSPVLPDMKQDVDIVRGESPEWEASTESGSSICTSPSVTSSSSSGEFDCSTNISHGYLNSTRTLNFEDAESETAELMNKNLTEEAQLFKVSSWDKDAIPGKSVLRSYNRLYLNEGKKTVSFCFPSESLIYEYPREEDLEDEENCNEIMNNGYETGYYTKPLRPSWNYFYDDRFTDYSTIADWDLGAEEMPELDEVGEYDEKDDDELSATSKRPKRSSWGTIYKLSDMPYEEEIDEELNEDMASAMEPPSFDLATYLEHINSNAYYMNGYESHANDSNSDHRPDEEDDENYWLQRVICTEDLIENTKCPFDLMDDYGEDVEADSETSNVWDINDSTDQTYDDNGLDMV